MPRVISYTPAWLCRPSPGFQLFNSEGQGSGANNVGTSYDGETQLGPNRTIARRNTEVFVAVGKQIRWADLPSVKDQWQAVQETPSKNPRPKGGSDGSDDGEEGVTAGDGSYRVLKVGVGQPIRQLCISPNGSLMAIATSHTVQIAILPKPDLLNAQHNTEPLKLKTYTIGPTTHVLSQSTLASILWHPLGESGNCLITVTSDAVVRLWEFNPDNRWSADSPALALDLRKLATAKSEQDEIAPIKSNRNKVFTSDAAGMDIAACCFGGSGYGDETPWSAMTLWIAMQSGDIYALCPLLPSKFQPPTDLLPALSSNIVDQSSAIEAKNGKDSPESQEAHDQLQWVHELDSEEPMTKEAEDEDSPDIEVYKRPSGLSAIPRLQGPFELLPEAIEDEELELSDIHVIPAKSDASDELLDISDSEDNFAVDDKEGLSCSLICLMTREGRVYVCVDPEGIEAQWLPRKPRKHSQEPRPEPYLVVLEALDTLKPGEACRSEWPTFTEDIISRYSFFTTHSRGVYYFSFSPWVQILEKELQAEESEGVQFRLSTLRNNLNTLRERILSFSEPQDSDNDPSNPASQVFQDSDLGYFLLTTSNSQPQAAVLDQPRPTASIIKSESSSSPDDFEDLAPAIPYQPYQPSQSFYARNGLTSFLDTQVPSRHRSLTKQHIRLSSATLDTMTSAHRVLSKETHSLGLAASDLFRRCHQLLEVLKNQIMKAQELGERVERVVGDDPEGSEGEDGEEEDAGDENMGKPARVLEKRIARARQRQKKLMQRWETLRSNVRKIGGAELGRKEREWAKEIAKVGDMLYEAEQKPSKEKDKEKEQEREREREEGEVVDDDDEGDENKDNNAKNEVSEKRKVDLKPECLLRYQEVKRLKDDLVPQAKDHSSTTNGEGEKTANGDETDGLSSPVPTDLKKKKIMEVKKMLERETMLVNDAQARLERLSLASAS